MQRSLGSGVLSALLLCSCGSDTGQRSAYVGPAFYTNVTANQDATNQPQNETTIAVNPTDRGNIVGGWNDYRVGTVHVGFASTSDGGATWTDGLVPESEHREQGDPAVAASADGDFYMAMISFERISNAGGVYVARSDNGGRTFLPAVRVQADPLIFEDKEYIAVDRSTSARRGTVYVTWTDFDDRRGHTEIRISRSTDRGQTWSTAGSVSGTVPYNDGYVQGSVPGVGLDGAVYVAWFDLRGDFAPEAVNGWREDHGPPLPQDPAWRRLVSLGGAILPQVVRNSIPGLDMVPNRVPNGLRLQAVEQSRLYVARSSDGGQTFGPPVVAAQAGPLPASLPFRTNGFPALSVVTQGPHFLHDERLYVTYASGDGRDSDIFAVASGDQGRSFSPPVRVSDDTSGSPQVFPWIAADETGAVHVVWYNRRDDPRGSGLSLYYAKSVDGGRSFSANRRVNPAPFSPFTDFNGEFIGDYNGIAAAGGVGYALWTDTRRGGQDVVYAPLQ